ncbi:MAG: nitrous oxide reductase accessory protein NosL, partial [Acidobacteriota bacterium]
RPLSPSSLIFGLVTLGALAVWIAPGIAPGIPPDTEAAPEASGTARELSESSGLRPDARDLCAVCGMFVARYPEWVAGVVFEDGSTAFFDGPKCLFEYLLHPDKHAGERRRPPIERALVTAYYDRRTIPAEGALFVVGSDVAGPMGAELVPHATAAEAEEFLSDHHGDRIVRFEEVTPELLATLHAPSTGR